MPAVRWRWHARQGLVANGFSKVESALKAGKVHTLVQAADAGADGVMKLDRLAGHLDVPVCVFYDTMKWVWHWGWNM
jgi:ribosomal protein L7Ae-like RNA K-turn-binding protein